MNPFQQLAELGQSLWVDNLQRTYITQGTLQKFIDQDGLKGLTSNPTIFQKAVEGSQDYQDLFDGAQGSGISANDLYEKLAVRDVQGAADILRPVYDSLKAKDGYASLEVSPLLALQTQGTLEEARRLWRTVNRPNVMIKIPGTEAGTPAIEQLTSEGLNINVTLLFSQEMYRKVAEAYVGGLENLAATGADISKVASVASFFISRIDALVDKEIEKKVKAGVTPEQQKTLEGLSGKVAIANAKLAYRIYKEVFTSARWKVLAAKGAQVQRVLWASTSTKSKKLSDVLYVEELIGRDTVNTMPPATIDAFRDHGKVRASIEENLPAAEETMRQLEACGISMKRVTDQLVVDGVRLFEESFSKLLSAVGEQLGKTQGGPKARAVSLPKELQEKVDASLAAWSSGGQMKKLWAKDASLWTGADEAKWLGWLDAGKLEVLPALVALQQEVKREGFTDVLLLGMGGSSLGPEVLSMTFGAQPGFPNLHVLDSTDPAQVQAFEKKIDLAKTLFIVSSKSGSTLEPRIFLQYFFERVKSTLGKDAGSRFIAITDPGSKLEAVAKRDKFRHVFPGLPSIGGRYSVLSNFGLVPAAVMGLDLERFLSETQAMVKRCGPDVPAKDNPGVQLGTVLGQAALLGRDKVTLVTSTAIHDVGAWLGQLLAESTGKNGKGVVPIDRELVAAPNVYGKDRLFIYVRDEAKPDALQDASTDALAKAGHPVVRLPLKDTYALGGEFFRWEIATAVAGAQLGINPFDQPDVEASKLETRKLTDAFEKDGSLPAEAPFATDKFFDLYTDAKNAAALGSSGSTKATELLKHHLNRLGPGDYFAVLAYVQMNPETEKVLQQLRHRIRDAKHVATVAEFGPRFLHSTGQAYKGGPNSGVFLQLTCDDAVQVPVPEQKYTFGIVKAAQARGDFEVLAERGRRALRVHLKGDLMEALNALDAAIQNALI